jgi:hypothetical protein
MERDGIVLLFIEKNNSNFTLIIINTSYNKTF